MKHYKLFGGLLALILMFTSLAPVYAIDTAGGTGDVPVELTQATTSFNVTVPTVLPVDVDADGVVTVATNNKIINNSFGPVEVKSVEVHPQNEWQLVEFTTDFAQKKVGLKEFGFQINESNILVDGGCEAEFEVIDGNSEIDFTYDANVASQAVKLTDVEIAQVVFTIGWYSDGNTSIGVTEYATVFTDNSWSDIATACQNNEVPATWNVGDTKPMTINGQEYNIQIIDKNHDFYSDGSGIAPLTLQMVELCADKAMMNTINTNKTGWSGSEMRTTTLSTILANMPNEVQSAIKAVDKQSIEGWGKNSSTPTTLETTSDKLFLLSETEVFGTTNKSGGVAEGSHYAYYANGGSTIKNYDGNAAYWWLRTPSYVSSNSFGYVGSSGSLYSGAANGSGGVAFGFCF